jgi:acetyl esterase/lipase
MAETNTSAVLAISSKHLVNRELIEALDAMPSFSVNADTLDEIRRAVSAVRVPAPAVPTTQAQERFLPRPEGTSLRVLVFEPAASRRSGGLLWLHGGGMVMGTADNNEALCRYLAETAECVVVAVDYRLAPEYPFPAGLRDCYAALRWLQGAADEFCFPGNRLAIAGESGGGCLAAGLALMARDRAEVMLSAQFLLYPMLDDRTGTASEPDPLPYTGEFVWTKDSNRFAWDAVLGQRSGGAGISNYVAPARAEDLTGTPPTSIFIGDLDLFLGENLRYVRNLARSGVPVEFQLYSGAFHGFISFAQEASISKRAFQAFSGAITGHFGR